MKNNTPACTISVVSEAVGVHQRTLRIYDEEGILVPKRTPKRRRLYSIDDIEKCKLIVFMTSELGLNLNGVKIILKIIPSNKISIDLLKEIAVKSGICENKQEINRMSNRNKGRKKSNV